MAQLLAKFLLRALIYLLGLVLVLTLTGVAAFVIARPQIDEFVAAEVRKRGLEVEAWDFGFNGRANLRGVRGSLVDGVEIEAALVSARPPLAGFSGAATLYDVYIKRGDVSLIIPKLDISGISQHDKDSKITQRFLQIIHQFEIGRLEAETITLKIGDEASVAGKLSHLQIKDIAKGKIGNFKFDGLESELDQITLDAGKGLLRTGAVEMRDLDIAGAFNYLIGQETENQTSIAIMGPMQIGEVSFDGAMAAQNLSMKLGSLNSQGVSLKPSNIVPLDVLRSFLMIRRDGGNIQERKQTQMKLLSLLDNLEKLDVVLNDMDIATETAQVSLHSLSMQSKGWELLFPEQFDLNVEGLILNLTKLPEDLTLLLDATGYNKIEADFSMEAQLDKAQQRLNLKNLSFIAQNIGDFSLQFQVDHVDPQRFFKNNEEGENWLQHIRLHDLDMQAKDRGAVANFVTIIAGIGGVDAQEISQGLEDMVRGTSDILFEDEELAANASEALTAFLQRSGLLRLHIASKTTDGVELRKILGGEIDWKSLLALMDIHFTHAESDNLNN